MIREGTTLHGTYRIERLLGQGGMGAVYAASHVRLPKHFAIKVLHAEVLKNQEAFTRFRREAEISTSIGHPNIVEVHDFNQTDDGQPYIVMEMLEGEDLSVHLKKVGRLDLARTLELLRQVGSALGAAHGVSVVHRDLKPQNIFLHRRGGVELVKILDFGISKITGSTDIQTKTSALIGTPAYMSPEQARARNAQLDARSDLFALASIVYEMLSGRQAFAAEGADAVSILFRIVTEDPPPLSDVVSEAIEGVVFKALSKIPDDRFPDVPSFVRSLEDAAAGRPVVGRKPSRGTAVSGATLDPVAAEQVVFRGGSGARTPLVVAGVALAGFVAFGGAWFALRPHKPAATIDPTPTVQAAPVAAPAKTRVTVRLDVEPRDATITVDGKPLARPLVELAVGQIAKLHVEAPGFEALDMDLPSDRDTTVPVRLAKAAPAAAKSKARPPRKATATARKGDVGGDDDLEDPFAHKH